MMAPATARFIPLSLVGFALVVLCGMFAALSGFGSRWGWWHFSTGFTLLKWSAIGALAAMVIAAAGALVPALGGGRYLAVTAITVVLGLAIAGVPWSWLREVKRLPTIHDITTDTDDPPQFRAVLEQRKDAVNPAEYGGRSIAEQQRRAYPDVKHLLLPAPPDEAFDRALAAVRKMGWLIVVSDQREGRIEATDTTFWFGFKDDVVVRIRQEGSGSRVDVRSLSRVGKSDVGTNARRIEKYLTTLQRIFP